MLLPTPGQNFVQKRAYRNAGSMRRALFRHFLAEGRCRKASAAPAQLQTCPHPPTECPAGPSAGGQGGPHRRSATPLYTNAVGRIRHKPESLRSLRTLASIILSKTGGAENGGPLSQEWICLSQNGKSFFSTLESFFSTSKLFFNPGNLFFNPAGLFFSLGKLFFRPCQTFFSPCLVLFSLEALRSPEV